MPDYTWLNVLDVGRQVGVPERTFVPPIPGETRAITEQNWDGASLRKAIACVAPCKAKGGIIVLTGHADAWVVLGIGYSLRPECEIRYGAELDGPGEPATVTQLLELPMGPKNPDLRFDYGMRVEGDNCYLDYRVDDPDAPPGVVHTFDNRALPELVLPEVPADKHLFLHAQACYYVQMNVTNSYARYALSVSTAYHDSPYYHCVASRTAELRPGDATARTGPVPFG